MQTYCGLKMTNLPSIVSRNSLGVHDSPKQTIWSEESPHFNMSWCSWCMCAAAIYDGDFPSYLLSYSLHAWCCHKGFSLMMIWDHGSTEATIHLLGLLWTFYVQQDMDDLTVLFCSCTQITARDHFNLDHSELYGCGSPAPRGQRSLAGRGQRITPVGVRVSHRSRSSRQFIIFSGRCQRFSFLLCAFFLWFDMFCFNFTRSASFILAVTSVAVNAACSTLCFHLERRAINKVYLALPVCDI